MMNDLHIFAWPVYLTPGSYTSLLMLGTGTWGTHDVTLSVYYTDGSSTSFSQGFSSWLGDGSTQTGESIVKTMTYFNNASGKQSEDTYVYGYVFPLDPTKTVSYLQLPNNNDLKLLALDLVNQPAQVDLNTPGTSYGTSTAFNQIGISLNGDGGGDASLDRSGDSYSANALGSTVSWDGQTFAMGSALIDNDDQFVGWPVYLPEESDTDLLLLGDGHLWHPQ